jgi:dihydroorotate dehydrogenase
VGGIDDSLLGLEGVFPHADYVTVNISSPNTKDLRSLQNDAALDGLLSALVTRRDALAREHRRSVPMFVKIAPDLDDAQIRLIAGALKRHRMDGVIATNTTVSRDAVRGLPHAEETGGLSGAPVFDASNRVIGALRAALGAKVPIIGVGGVLSGDAARAKRAAGADLVQIYTGLIYKGPALVAECAAALAR